MSLSISGRLWGLDFGPGGVVIEIPLDVCRSTNPKTYGEQCQFGSLPGAGAS